LIRGVHGSGFMVAMYFMIAMCFITAIYFVIAKYFLAVYGT
jgi:hypothetical protein